MSRMFTARSLGLVAALSMTLAACDGADGDDVGTGDGATEAAAQPLRIGTLLPMTGSLSQLGPPTSAGVDLAVREINEAGGVLGMDVEVSHKDSADADDARVATESVAELIDEKVSVVVGAASAQVTLDVMDDVTGAEIVQISPASTPVLPGSSDFFFRTAPPDAVQGDVLGRLIISDGHASVALLVLDEDYGTGLRDVVRRVVEQAGGMVTYGIPGEEFDATEQNFTTIVDNALATRPDAVAIIALAAQTTPIVAELVAQGFDLSRTYFVDRNLQDFGDQLGPRTLEGAQGTRPGVPPSEEFRTRLLEVDPGLQSFDHAAESYDATMLAALAAVRGGGTDGPTIQANMAAVSGTGGGTECTGFVECAELLGSDEGIVYQAASGAGPFDAANAPSAANIGIYLFDGANNPSFQRAEAGGAS